MADILGDGAIKVSWCSTMANPLTPTTAEVTAGIPLESFITPDGLNVAITTDEVDASSIASNQYQTIPGRKKGAITLTFKNQGESNPPFTTFAGRPDGFLVIRYGLASTQAYASAQKVWVFPARASDRAPIAPAANEMLKFQVPMNVTGTISEAVSLT